MSKGKRRVVMDFNPSENPVVDEIKGRAADLIDYIEELPNGPDAGRWKAEAQTLIETGAMFAVKAATAR